MREAEEGFRVELRLYTASHFINAEVPHMSHSSHAGGALVLIAFAFVTTTQARPGPWASEFEIATINVERNATDGDTEVVLSIKPGDEGLKYLAVRAPNKRSIIDVFSVDRSVMGMREFELESPEPAGSAILAAYPQGIYKFTGLSTSGEWFYGEARLSHQMPAETVIMSPAEGSEVVAGPLRLEWSAVPGLRKVVVELENESSDPEQILSVELPPDATSLDVPAAFMRPGSDYQLGIATVGTDGNITVVEITFTTAPQF